MLKLTSFKSSIQSSLFALLLCLGVSSPLLAEDSPIQILVPGGELKLGTIYQGENKALQYDIKNISKKNIRFDAVIPQGVGPKNIKFPKTLKPGEKGTVRFEYISAYLAGPVKEHITLVSSDNKDYSLKIVGEVKARFFFNEPVLDFGFMSGKTEYKSTYVWGEKNQPFDFKAVKSKGVSVKLTQVYIDPTKIDEVVEVNKSSPKAVFAYKVSVQVDPTSIKKSLSQLLAFQSKAFPKATPEIHLVGYKK